MYSPLRVAKTTLGRTVQLYSDVCQLYNERVGPSLKKFIRLDSIAPRQIFNPFLEIR
jgi:hypothetical protein